MDQQPIQNLQPEIQSPKPASKIWQIAVLVVVGILVIGGISYGSYCMWQKASDKESQQVCTQEAKLCSDGSSVGRTGPNCEFAACPGSQVSSLNSASKTFILQGLQMILPDKWSVKSQPSSIISSTSSIDIDTSGAILSLGIRAASSDEDIIKLSEDSEIIKISDGKIFQIGCGGPMGCVGMVIKNNYYYITWDGSSDHIYSEPGEITMFELNFTNQDVYDILKTAEFANDATADLSAKASATTDWQTYKNEQYGFEMRYPKEWFFENNTDLSFVRFSNYDPKKVVGRELGGKDEIVDLSVKTNFENKNIENILNCGKEEGVTLLGCENVSLDDIVFKKRLYINDAFGGMRSMELAGLLNSKIYKFSVWQTNDKANQIIFTFKFTK